ncbi:MAG: hypothetical protein NC453_25645 [Muribaculum sp.]|nr:hypothetical protein [Muribaculum sp.]
MRSFSSLVHGALFPSTRVYHDANGNFRGSSTDVTPWMLLLGRVWGFAVWLYVILTPFLAPVYFIFAHWFCRKYDAEFTKEDPKGWPEEKRQILKNHRNILIGWIIFMVWGYCIDWGQNRLPYNYTQPYPSETHSTWDPDHPERYQDPYGQYNHYK